MYDFSFHYREAWVVAVGPPLGCRGKNLPLSGLELPPFESDWSKSELLSPFLLYLILSLCFFYVTLSFQFFLAQALSEILRPKCEPGICLQPAGRLSLSLITAQLSVEPVHPASMQISI